jgi:hypothetical protein
MNFNSSVELGNIDWPLLSYASAANPAGAGAGRGSPTTGERLAFTLTRSCRTTAMSRALTVSNVRLNIDHVCLAVDLDFIPSCGQYAATLSEAVRSPVDASGEHWQDKS